MQNPTSDCSELLRKTAATLSNNAVLRLFLAVQKKDLSLTIEYAIKRLLLHVELCEAKLLTTQNNSVVFQEWKLLKRKREWREMVENILHYFPQMVCETYLSITL